MDSEVDSIVRAIGVLIESNEGTPAGSYSGAEPTTLCRYAAQFLAALRDGTVKLPVLSPAFSIYIAEAVHVLPQLTANVAAGDEPLSPDDRQRAIDTLRRVVRCVRWWHLPTPAYQQNFQSYAGPDASPAPPAIAAAPQAATKTASESPGFDDVRMFLGIGAGGAPLVPPHPYPQHNNYRHEPAYPPAPTTPPQARYDPHHRPQQVIMSPPPAAKHTTSDWWTAVGSPAVAHRTTPEEDFYRVEGRGPLYGQQVNGKAPAELPPTPQAEKRIRHVAVVNAEDGEPPKPEMAAAYGHRPMAANDFHPQHRGFASPPQQHQMIHSRW